MHRFLFGCALCLLISIGEKHSTITYEVGLRDEKSVFGIEDLEGRLAYERLLTANPYTGEIPRNIRSAELAFGRTIALQTESARTQALDIQSIGPNNVGGRTRAVAFDVRDENTILAGGVSGAMWKSTDGGLNWRKTSDPQNRNSVTCLVQDTRPGREDTWYHGTGELIGNSARGGGAPFRGNGIYKSTDNGETWNAIPSTEDSEPTVFNSQFQYIWRIQLNDRNLLEDEVIVAAFGGILRSLDGGDTWNVELGQQLFDLHDSTNLNDINASFFTDLEKTSDGVFFATLSTFSSPDGNSPDAGIYVSEDGDEWYDITPFTAESEYRRIVMGHAPSNPSECYFLVNSNPSFLVKYDINFFNAQGVSGTWTDLAENIPAFGGDLGDFDAQQSFNMMVKVHPEDPSMVFIGGTNLYRSTDGYSTSDNTSWIGGYDPEGSANPYLNHHPDQHDLLFYPSDPDRILSASDGGIIISVDGTADSVIWEDRNNGYLTSQFFTIALSKEADDIIMGGMQDNGTDLSAGTTTWEGITGGDGGYAATTPGKELYFSSFQNGQTFRLTLNEEFNITSFARIDPEGLVKQAGSDYLFINPYVLDPINSNRMFIAGGNYLYVNENISQIPGGSQVPVNIGWERLEGTLSTAGLISSIDISLDGTTVYAGSAGGKLLKVMDANDPTSRTSQEITNAVFPEGYISSISINPEDEDHLLLVFSNYEIPSIFESFDGGQTFSNISGNLEQLPDGGGNGPSIRWCELIPLNSGILYLVGTSIGLYSTENVNGLLTVWTQESPDLLGSAVIPMMDYRALDGRLAIATHGNGVFTTDIPDFKSIQIDRPGLDFSLGPVYPNPFNATTEIEYSIPEDGTVRIDLYSSKGEFIKNLLWAPQFAGESSITWDGTNTAGGTVANGLYLYRVEYRGGVRTGRISLRK